MPTIMLVDDDDEFRTILGESLRRAGYEVREASDGRQGLKLYREQAADLIITDLIMPEKEGLEMIQEVLRLRPDVKIIAISGGSRDGSSDYLKIAKVFGARRVLAKPFAREEMLNAIKELLGLV
jgi:CheY-like chemotaxis protein